MAESFENAEVAALKKQVKSLQKKMSSKVNKVSDVRASALRVEPYRPRGSDDSVYYRCGEFSAF